VSLWPSATRLQNALFCLVDLIREFFSTQNTEIGANFVGEFDRRVRGNMFNGVVCSDKKSIEANNYRRLSHKSTHRLSRLSIRGRDQLFGGTSCLYLHAIRCRSGGGPTAPNTLNLWLGGPVPPVPPTPTCACVPIGAINLHSHRSNP